MTKKDYVFIANCLSGAYHMQASKADIPMEKDVFVRYFVGMFMTMLKKENEKFDQQKFIDYIKERI